MRRVVHRQGTSFHWQAWYTRQEWATETKRAIFIVAPCIMTTLMFLSPTNALLYYLVFSSKYHQRIKGTITTHKIMNKPTRNKHPLFKIANDALVDLPTPSTVRGWWNFGSLLGICLVAQIATGLFLAIHYCPNVEIAFSRVSHICRDVNW